jgi:hypothetical protein
MRKKGTSRTVLGRSLATALAVALLAGCGGTHRSAPPPPKLGHALGVQFATLSDSVANRLRRGDACGARADATALRSQAAAAITAGEVPPPLRTPLTSATTRLVAQIQCLPPAPEEHKHGEHHDHGDNGGDGGGGH